MLVQNVTNADLALIEILTTGRTDAPRDVLNLHHTLGHVEIVDGKRVLTAKGRKRAETLRGCEQGLRTEAANAATGSAIRAVASSGIVGAPRKRS